MVLVLVGATGLAAGQLPGGAALTNTAGRLAGPIQRPLTSASRGLSAFVRDLRQMDALRGQLSDLETQNAELVTQNAKMVDLIRENRTLRGELGFVRERVDLDLMGSSIIGHRVAEEPGNVRRSIKLDVGSRDGVETWMPVANHLGLIGQVIHTAPYWSDVLLITDPASKVEGRIARSRHTGIVSGGPDGDLAMRYIEQERDEADPVVQVGDLVYTSGLSQRFPPMILIGQVTRIRQSDEQAHQEAIVRPAVNFGALEAALVVRDWLPPTLTGVSGPAETGSEGR